MPSEAALKQEDLQSTMTDLRRAPRAATATLALAGPEGTARAVKAAAPAVRADRDH